MAHWLKVVVTCGLAGLAVSACTSRREAATARVDAPERGDVMGRTGQAAQAAAQQAYRGMGEAVTTPLRDLNLTREEIPIILLSATDAPYQTRTVFDCPSIAAEVAALDVALGPDVDTPKSEQNTDYYRMGADQAAEATLDAVRDAAEGIVPVRGWVRRLSGAKRNERRVKEAIYAGSIRRAFLKGMGDHRGCAPPAAPMVSLHERRAADAAEAEYRASVQAALAPVPEPTPPPVQPVETAVQPATSAPLPPAG